MGNCCHILGDGGGKRSRKAQGRRKSPVKKKNSSETVTSRSRKKEKHGKYRDEDLVAGDDFSEPECNTSRSDLSASRCQNGGSALGHNPMADHHQNLKAKSNLYKNTQQLTAQKQFILQQSNFVGNKSPIMSSSSSSSVIVNNNCNNSRLNSANQVTQSIKGEISRLF